MNDWLVFLIIQAAMVAFSYSEAVLEGHTGWARDKKVWRFKLHGMYDYTSYHLVTYFVLFPLLIIVLPLAIAGWSAHLFWLLLASYLFGSILEDFFWFIFNPLYSFKKWNPKDTTWYPWIRVGWMYVPLSYVVKFLLTILIVVYFL